MLVRERSTWLLKLLDEQQRFAKFRLQRLQSRVVEQRMKRFADDDGSRQQPAHRRDEIIDEIQIVKCRRHRRRADRNSHRDSDRDGYRHGCRPAGEVVREDRQILRRRRDVAPA